MKRFVFFICLSFACNSITISQTWEFYDENDEYKEYFSHAVEYELGKLISVSVQFHPVVNEVLHNNSMIRIQDVETGNVIKEVMYKIDTLSARLSWVFYNDLTRNFIIAGSATDLKTRNNRGYLLVTIWDEELNFLSDTLVRLEPYEEFNRLYYMAGNNKNEKEFLIVGHYSDSYDIPFPNSKLLICRIDSSGTISLMKWFKRRFFNSSIFFDSINQRYVMYADQTLFLNSDLEIIDSVWVIGPNYVKNFGEGLSAIIDTGKYLVSAHYGEEKGIAIIDTELRLIKEIKIPIVKYGYDYHFHLQNFDYIDTTEIYYGTYNRLLEYFSVIKVNSKLDPYWIKYYGKNNGSYYFVMAIVATSDGGCIVLGGKSIDPLGPGGSFNSSAWALKLDADGNTVSTKDHSPTRWEITVYPNPSSGYFRIEIAGEVHSAVLMLFDMQGRQVRHYDQLSEGSHTFDFSGLPTGAYVWKLLRNGEVLGDGKWIKGR